MRKQFIPPTIEEVRAYIIEHGLYLVSAKQFVEYYADQDWHYSNYRGKWVPVMNWKGKLRGWQAMNLERGVSTKRCQVCKQAADYPRRDDTGQVYWMCEAHKPKPKRILPNEMTKDLFKLEPFEMDVNAERNRQRKGLGL